MTIETDDLVLFNNIERTLVTCTSTEGGTAQRGHAVRLRMRVRGQPSCTYRVCACWHKRPHPLLWNIFPIDDFFLAEYNNYCIQFCPQRNAITYGLKDHSIKQNLTLVKCRAWFGASLSEVVLTMVWKCDRDAGLHGVCSVSIVGVLLNLAS